MCQAMKHTKEGESQVCKYKYHSSDDKFESSRVLSTEAFYLKSSEKNEQFLGIVFGCDDSHENDLKDGIQAVVGLGQGSKLSLLHQLGGKVGGKFSYCLEQQPVTHASKIRFGSVIRLYNRELEYKAKITYDHPYPFYYVTLEAISINRKRIEIQQLVRVDIQTAITTFPPKIYEQLLDTLTKAAGGETPFKHQEYDTCFHKSRFSRRVPELKLHFKATFGSKAIFPLDPHHFLVFFDKIICLTIVPKEGAFYVLRNRAQVNVQMIFDLSSRVLTYAPLNCIQFSV
ncbi:probable aspartic protease At2g35615 [Tripterygium wilfordii]|uniref:probable aspartic protease At2g35615 n=1 Tax=Tripterygium wilfordii TaxID=458696 RepID=UPI0018F84E59|nr:probable aspartic protease At2g35615 [Tripterygium wilfordii]